MLLQLLIMRVHYRQHVPFEGLGSVQNYLQQYGGHEITGTHLYQGKSLSSLFDFDLLVVRGGPMGASECPMLYRLIVRCSA